MSTIPAAYTATYTANNLNALWYIEIEGLRKRYGSKSPSWNPADSGTNRRIEPWFLEPGIPQISGQRAKPLNGSTTPHSFSVEIVDIGDALTSLLSVNDDSTRHETTLTAACTATQTTIHVDSTTGFSVPSDIYVERETMRATSKTSTTFTVSRGMYGSRAEAHELTNEQGEAKSVSVTDKPLFITTREVKLYESRTGLAEASGAVLRGYLDSVEEHGGVYTFGCSGYLKRMACKIGGNTPVSELVYPLAPLVDRTAAEQAALDESWSDFIRTYLATSWCVEVYSETPWPAAGGLVQIDNELIKYTLATANRSAGAKFQLLVLDDDYMSDYMSAATSDTTRIKFRYTSTGKGRGERVMELMGGPVTSQTSDLLNQFSVRSKYIRMHFKNSEVKYTLSDDVFTAGTDPISIVLQILLSGGDGGTYDTLIDAWGLGLPESAVDITGMEDLRDTSPVKDMPCRFVINEEVDAKDWLEKNILRPARLFFVETWDGKISLSRLWSKFEAEQLGADLAVDESILLDTPKFNLGKQPLGKFKIKCNYYAPEDHFYGTINVIMGDRGDIYRGGEKNYELEAKALVEQNIGADTTKTYDSRALGALHPQIRAYMQMMWDRFALTPMPIIEVEIPYSYLAGLQVGSIITVTSTITPNVKASQRGLTGEYFQVVEVHPLPMRSSMRLVAWMIDIHDKPYRKLAPSCKVKYYHFATKILEVYPHEFSSASNPKTDAELVWDGKPGYVKFVDSNYIELTSGETIDISVITSTAVTLKTHPASYPTDGDYMEIATYCTGNATAQAVFSYLADSNDKLGTSDDQGHTRI